MKNLKSIVETYVNQGIKVFGANLNKTPATPHGFKDATLDLTMLRWQFDDWNEETRLIGLPTGQVNRILVIDIDVGKGDDGRSRDELRQYIEDTYGPLPDTLTTETPSGGIHLAYGLPAGIIVASKSRFFDKTAAVDVRCDGGYIICADWSGYMPIDQDNLDDYYKKLTPCPEWIFKHNKNENIVPGDSGEHNTSYVVALDASELTEIRSALGFLESDDRDLWVNVGMALKASGAMQSRGLWDEWSQKSDKFDPVDQEKKWRSLKPRNDIQIPSIFYFAKQKGWQTTYKTSGNFIEQPTPASNFSKEPEKVYTEDEVVEIISKQQIEKLPPFPTDLLTPPGLVGEIAKYINSQAFREQPILAVGAALTISGTLMGRRFETDAEMIRTNLYCVGIADTGAGKENARSCAKKIFGFAGEDAMTNMCCSETLASDTSIFSTLSEAPCQLFLLDEIGRLLKTTKNPMKQSHLYNIPTVLQEVYGQSNQVMFGKSYADTKKKFVIKHPNLSIWGTATPKQFFGSLSEDNLTDGLISRMLVFQSDNPNPDRRKVRLTEPDGSLMDQVMAIYDRPQNIAPKGNIDKDVGNCRPLKVPYHSEAEELFDIFCQECDDMKLNLRDSGKPDMLYTRADVMARKIGLILSVGQDVLQPAPIIMPEHAEYSIKLVKHLIGNMQFIAEHHVSANEHEENVKLIWSIIREKGHVMAYDLARRTHHLQTWVRNDIITTLIDSNIITEAKYNDGTNRRNTMYLIIQK